MTNSACRVSTFGGHRWQGGTPSRSSRRCSAHSTTGSVVMAMRSTNVSASAFLMPAMPRMRSARSAGVPVVVRAVMLATGNEKGARGALSVSCPISGSGCGRLIDKDGPGVVVGTAAAVGIVLAAIDLHSAAGGVALHQQEVPAGVADIMMWARMPCQSMAVMVPGFSQHVAAWSASRWVSCMCSSFNR